MRKVSEIVYKKENGKWIETYRNENPADVYRKAFNVIRAKKIHKCTWITKLEEHTNYDGTRTLTAYGNNGFKWVYITEN